MADGSDVTLGIIGAGIMGRGIAHVAAVAGFETVLNDISDDLLRKSQDQIRDDLNGAVEIGKLTLLAVEETLARLKLERSLETAVRNADLVIEAVPEKIELKLDIFSRLDQICGPEVIFASNTSALSITEMAGATTRPQRFIGILSVM